MERPEPSRGPEDPRTGKVARAHLVARVEQVAGEAETARPVLARAAPPAVVETPATAVPMLVDKAAWGPAEPPVVALRLRTVRAARAGSGSTV